MQTIKNYKEFNESKFDIRANLKPKSKEELETIKAKMDADELLLQSSKDGNIKSVQLALDSGADPSDNNNWTIRWASRNGHKEVVELLLKDSRVDPSDDDNMAIRWASQFGHLDVVKLLLKYPKVDPSGWDNFAIRLASHNGHKEVVKLLLKDKRVLSTLTPEEIKEYKDKL